MPSTVSLQKFTRGQSSQHMASCSRRSSCRKAFRALPATPQPLQHKPVVTSTQPSRSRSGRHKRSGGTGSRPRLGAAAGMGRAWRCPCLARQGRAPHRTFSRLLLLHQTDSLPPKGKLLKPTCSTFKLEPARWRQTDRPIFPIKVSVPSAKAHVLYSSQEGVVGGGLA